MQEALTEFLKNYPLLSPAIFIVVRALAIIIPPIPGAFVDIAGLVFFGWVKSLILAEIGIMLGAMASFAIARRFREPAVRKFVSLEKVISWEKNLSEKKRFWGFVGLRLMTNSLFDYISYAAGLSTMSVAKFFLASFIGSIPGLLIFYYFGGLFYQNSIYYLLVFLTTLFILGSVVSKKLNIFDFIGGLYRREGEEKD